MTGTDHDWLDVTTNTDSRRRDYICGDCGRTKTTITVSLPALIALALAIAVIVAWFPW